MITHTTLEDIPDLAAMLRVLHALHVAHLPIRFHNEASDEELRDFFRHELQDGAGGLIYRTDGVARGYLLWKPQITPRTPLVNAQRLAVLDHVYVAPGFRRRGVGRRLLRRFEADMAKDFDGWFTRVHCFNSASLALMRGAGAADEVIALRKMFYSASG